MEADRTHAAFDPVLATHHGAFISIAYTMHSADPENATPTPLPPPPGFKFIAWVQMKDFVVSSGDWAFYGLLAQSIDDHDQFVLAFRGTSNLEEWWDDLTSLVPAPWAGPGRVGFGFNRIYQTLRIVEFPAPPSLEGMASPLAVRSGPFAEQVADTLHHYAGVARPPIAALGAALPAVKTIAVTGHSLGAALATLYVAENTHRAAAAPGTPLEQVKVSALFTFASPRVGDGKFAEAFDALPIGSWRIVNELDVVPKLPAIGFEHVDHVQQYNSGTLVRWSPRCWHSLQTYIHLLDPKLPLDIGCSWSAATVAAAPATAAMASQAPPQDAGPKGVLGGRRRRERDDDHHHNQDRLIAGVLTKRSGE